MKKGKNDSVTLFGLYWQFLVILTYTLWRNFEYMVWVNTTYVYPHTHEEVKDKYIPEPSIEINYSMVIIYK